MSICRGVAGRRKRNPVGIFLHNDAGSQNATAAYYKDWLQTHNLSIGFAHYYVASDDTLQAEEDANCAWHCGNLDGNLNYLSIEICQSRGELDTFKTNEERALVLAAQKCKQYGIVPSNSTIRLHQEVFATACPHKSVEIHGGAAACKAYFIKRIVELMKGSISVSIYAAAPNTSGIKQNIGRIGAGIVFTYAVKAGGSIYPEVTNLTDFAGVRGVAITDITIKVNKGSVKYRVHIKGGGWLPYVTGYNWNDYNNGYAGNGKVIDAIEVYYNTPSDIVSEHGYQKAQYRVSPINGNYWPWQYDNETKNDQDGYAGTFGVAIDRFQLY